MISLNAPIESVPKVSRRIIPALKKLSIKTVRDLLFHFPTRYDDFSNKKNIREVEVGETVTVQGAISKIQTIRTARRHMVIVQASIKDATGSLRATWFNQPFLARILKEGTSVALSGKVTLGPNGKYLQNPAYEKLQATSYKLQANTIHTGGLIPVYPETRGLTSRWLRFLIKNLIDSRKELTDPLPPETRKKYLLPEVREAVLSIHFPKNKTQAERARHRFNFEELLLIQLRALHERMLLKRHSAPAIPLNLALVKEFVGSLPYQLTNAQRRSMWEIFQDMARPRPMNRLLEGDVGSGKTVVAAAAALLTIKQGLRVAFMAPTEILAHQHFETIKKVLAPFSVKTGLLTGSTKKELNADILVGTHALFQKSAKLENLGLAVVDEQHRFGVNQRAALIRGQTRTEKSRTNADKLLYEDITYKIRGCVFDVKDKIGIGHKESVYHKALAEAFTIACLDFATEKQLPIIFNGKRVGTYQPDFIVEDKIIIELKALPFIGNTEKRQLWTYAKGSEYKVALLVNFGPRGADIQRVVYDTARSPRRSALGEESPRQSAILPHFLSMSATPIPRTLALTIYGDLDLSILDEMPKSRKQVITKIIEPEKRLEAYQFIRDEVKRGRQAFVICPRIDSDTQTDADLKESLTNADTTHIPRESAMEKGQRQSALWTEVKAVKEEYKKLKDEIFQDLKVGMLHGKLPAKGGSASGGKSKEQVMKEFREGRIDILVSTSVVEVGVDIPNATIMMIEGAERFGLAQLHQFRGRVGRGADQSYCFLFPTEDSVVTKRLRALVEAKNGFELAEKDLEIRGPGDLFGTRQWGVSDNILAALTDAKLVREVRQEAVEITKKSPDLSLFPELKMRISQMDRTLHPE